MLDEIAIAQINTNLELCDSYLLNQSEIDYQNAIGADPQSTCEYWEVTQNVLLERAQFDDSINYSLELCLQLSTVDGCDLSPVPEQVPVVDIPYFGGGL